MSKLSSRGVIGLALVLPATGASAQTLPWIQFQDFSSPALCGLVHAANAELVVLTETGQMTIVSGPDVTLADVSVDSSGNVFFEGTGAGFIDFDEDADGNRALFWLTLTGRLVAIGAFDAAPQESDSSPGDSRNTGCDPCPQWDDQSICAPDEGEPDEAEDGEAASPLAGLCGGGAASAAMLLILVTLVGRRLR